MKSIEELRKKHAEELEEALANHALATTLQTPPDMVLFGQKQQPWITHEVDTLVEAWALAVTYNWVEYVFARGTFTYLDVRDRIKDTDEQLKECTVIQDGVPHITVQTIKYTCYEELVFFTRLQDGRVARVLIKSKRPTVRIHLRNYSGHIQKAEPRDYPRIGEDELVTWWSGEEAARATYIWHSRLSFETGCNAQWKAPEAVQSAVAA